MPLVPFYKGDKISEVGKTYDLQVTFEGKTYHASTVIKQSPAKSIRLITSLTFMMFMEDTMVCGSIFLMFRDREIFTGSS
jgi:hypothetical protein